MRHQHSSLALGSPMRFGIEQAGMEAAWRSRSSASRTCIFDFPMPSCRPRFSSVIAIVARAARHRACAAADPFRIDGLFGLLRQLTRHLFLGAAEDERPQPCASSCASLRPGCVPPRSALEHRGRAQHAGIEELEQAPQALPGGSPRGSAERQPVPSLEQPRGLGRFAPAFLIACASSRTM